MRWLVRVAGSLALLAFLAVGALFLIPAEKIASLAAAQFQKQTGRSMVLEGALRPTLWPRLGVRTGPVSIANADWSTQGPFLRADALEIAIDMAALIGGTIRVTGIDAVAPRLVLETSTEGQVNWNLAPAGEAAATPAAAAPFTLDRARITDGAVTWIDHRSGTRLDLTDIALQTAIPAFDGPVTITGQATTNGQTVALDARIANFAAFLTGAVGPLAFKADAGGSTAAFDGRLGTAPFAAEGRVDADLADLPALFAALGQSAPALPQGLGNRAIAVAGALTLTPEGSVHLRDGTLRLDDNTLSGAFDLTTAGARPNLTARLTAGALDLAALGGGDGGGAGSGTGGWSTASIDASGLGVLDASVALDAESIDLGLTTLGRTRAAVKLDAARAVVDLTEVQAYGGTITGQYILNARKGLSMRADLALSSLALQPLLTELAGYDRLIGTGDLRFNILASGGSMDALMRSLSGDGTLAFGAGELRGLDLAGMLRTLDPNFVGEGSKTIFDAITASFSLADGILANPDLAFTAPLMAAAGAGRVDIGGQTLDYRVIPSSLGGTALDDDLQVPLRITGPWAAPKFRLDLESLAERKLEEEKQRLEDRARAELAKKAEEELGIVMQDGESLEDAARRRAEEVIQDETTKALEKLLQGLE